MPFQLEHREDFRGGSTGVGPCRIGRLRCASVTCVINSLGGKLINNSNREQPSGRVPVNPAEEVLGTTFHFLLKHENNKIKKTKKTVKRVKIAKKHMKNGYQCLIVFINH